MLQRTLPAGFIAPCLPSPAERPPTGPQWIHEIKHDGYRMMARRDGTGVRLLTRDGHDWTGRFPPTHGDRPASGLKPSDSAAHVWIELATQAGGCCFRGTLGLH